MREEGIEGGRLGGRKEEDGRAGREGVRKRGRKRGREEGREGGRKGWMDERRNGGR